MNGLETYIKRIEKIKWFTPVADRDAVDTAAKAALKAFEVDATPEYRSFFTFTDWGAIRDAPWSPQWAQARYMARDAAWIVESKQREQARDLAWETAFNAANNEVWHEIHHAIGVAAWDARIAAAWAAAWGAQELLAAQLPEYKGAKAFLSLVELYALGVYPMGVIDKKFVIYTN